VPHTRERLADLEPLWRAPDSVDELLAEAERLEPVPPTVLAHGDLHFRHLLVQGGALAGVIDWGDICRADPSIDLPLCWCTLTPDGRSEFFAAYGRITEDQLLRAQVIAIFLCAVLAVYGANEGLDTVVREALTGLERCVSR
jgi:aminoglycoside phosphotransferase (APT) family kinase protein